MNFKDLKPGATLYILHRDTMQLTKSSVVTVSAPHIENKANSVTQLVVDITVNSNGKPVTYVMPDSGCVSYCDGMILTTDKACLINEIKGIKSQRQAVVDSYEASKLDIEKCDALISELDDAYREKKEADERLSKLESLMTTILEKISTPVSQPVVAVPAVITPQV